MNELRLLESSTLSRVEVDVLYRFVARVAVAKCRCCDVVVLACGSREASQNYSTIILPSYLHGQYRILIISLSS